MCTFWIYPIIMFGFSVAFLAMAWGSSSIELGLSYLGVIAAVVTFVAGIVIAWDNNQRLTQAIS